MMNPARGEMAAIFTDDVPIAATDGSNLILNPKRFFDEFKLDERVFIVAHEVLHCVLNHCHMDYRMRKTRVVKYPDGTKLPYDAQVMNMAMDYVINDILIKDKIGQFPSVGLHDPSIGTKDDNFLDVYRKLMEQDNGKNGKGQPGAGGAQGQGQGQGGFDVILDPGSGQGQDAGTADQARSQTEWDTAVAGALASAKMQGKLSANLERLLGEIVEPTVSWQDHIRGFFARKVGGDGYNWRKPDRRLIQRGIYAPQRAGNGCGSVVVGIDTSGSIGQPELNQFFAEMIGILEDVRPKRIHVVWCDAQVHKVDEVDDAQEISALKPHGGGGTDFRPVFDWIAEQDFVPDALVYLTDMMGRFPDHAPNYPVVWGDIYGRCKAPFGDVVPVPIGKK
jgi:predicted metal-dependent peptidase